MKKIQILIILAFFAAQVNAQISVDNSAPYNSAQYLVDNVLSGNGVVATNIVFNGDAEQLGFFNGSTSTIGLDSGIVISTGKVTDIPNGGNQPDTDLGGGTDADLLTIAQSVRSGISSTGDAASLEFDFTVVGDTVEFRFVFASEEYLQYVNSDYNDIFAFFLSGPGITGPYSSPAAFPDGAVNVAVLPGTATPITISTIHPTLNSQFYIDNPTDNTHDFNGFTTVITVKYAVICGETFHFKFSIADCQDKTLDTGVFLEANSLTSSGVTINSNLSTIIEGCNSSLVTITRSDTSVNDTIDLIFSGNAIPSEYTTIAAQQIFATGASSLTFNVEAFVDNITEGVDTIIIEIQGNTGCNMVKLYIEDYTPMNNLIVSDSMNICTDQGETALIWAKVDGGKSPFSYQWNNNVGPGDTLIVAPAETTYYTPIIWDDCGNSIEGEAIPVLVQCQLIKTNVFTPNGDGMNDYFTLFNLDDYPAPSLKIYNRWGVLVYENDAYENDWDGGDLKEGTYFYIVEPKSNKFEYEPSSKEKFTLKGTLHLFR